MAHADLHLRVARAWVVAEGADGTDINACARNNTGNRELIATADDFGKVKLFRYPCIVPNADHKPYGVIHRT